MLYWSREVLSNNVMVSNRKHSLAHPEKTITWKFCTNIGNYDGRKKELTLMVTLSLESLILSIKGDNTHKHDLVKNQLHLKEQNSCVKRKSNLVDIFDQFVEIFEPLQSILIIEVFTHC